MLLNQLPFAFCYALLAALIFEIHCTGDKTMWIHPKIGERYKALNRRPPYRAHESCEHNDTNKIHWLLYISPLAATGTLKPTREAYLFNVACSSL